jgi:hypothetical protein
MLEKNQIAFVQEIKEQIKQAQYRALQKVNRACCLTCKYL